MGKNPKFAGKYRNGTFRCARWNYASDGWYYVTICNKYRSPDFGVVDHGIMVLNDIGNIVRKHWLKIPQRFSCLFLDQFIIMPDHIHGIIRINHTNDYCRCVSSKRTYNQYHARYEYEGHSPRMSQISSLPGSLSVAIQLFKGDCVKEIRQLNPDFQWQSRFHDRIIRSPGKLHKKRLYIQNNPTNYEK